VPPRPARRLTGLLLALPLAAVTTAAAAALDYNRDVKPILAENCFACHGFDEAGRKAKLRLDVAAEALAPRANGPAIKPGDAAGSEVWQRIISPHADEVMPPPEAHKTLTAAQRETLRAWIEAGAPYAEHWAFVPPRATSVPAGAAHPVDAFVRARLRQEGLTPAPAADARALIRRVSLDLTGLPPSATEAEAFAADRDPRAYERLVTRLLASPHFGERLAVD
jgi:mono/diheme cytochrome c family protein